MKDFKTMSGSSRDKTEATPKQDKWKDPFYCEARGQGVANHRRLFNHKVDSIRNSVQADGIGMFKSFINSVSSFFNRIFK